MSSIASARPRLATLRAKWQDHARPGYWSDVLYYSFTPPKAPRTAKIADPAAKKSVAAKKPVAAKKSATAMTSATTMTSAAAKKPVAAKKSATAMTSAATKKSAAAKKQPAETKKLARTSAPPGSTAKTE